MEGKYSIYLRKSRTDIEAEMKGEGETLARHEHILLDLANRKGLEIGKIYKEIVSGETIEARPKVQELLSDVKSGMWDGVLVVEVERLARGETMDQGIVAKAFKISDTKIITPMKTYDPNNEFDEEYFEFGLFMSRREYKVINRRLQRGRIASVEEGKYVGSVSPFGYDRVKIKGDKGYTLKKNMEANTVKLIYNLYAYEDLSLCKITKKLNLIGLKPRKNSKWSVSSVRDILENPVYIGKIKWNARKEVKIYKNEKLIKTRPRNNNYILVNGLHRPIIDENTWKIVEVKRNFNSIPVKHSNEVKNPLCGLVYCAKCGRKMKRRPYNKSGQEPVLFCDNPECNNISIKLYLVEEKIIEGLRKWLEQYEISYDKYIEKIKQNKIKSIEETIETLKLEVRKEKHKLESIYNFLEDGTYTKETFKVRSGIILKNIEKSNSAIEEYERKLQNENESEKFSVFKVENIIDIYNFLETPEEKNDLLKKLLSKVTYLKTEKTIKKNSNPTEFVISLYPKIGKNPASFK